MSRLVPYLTSDEISGQYSVSVVSEILEILQEVFLILNSNPNPNPNPNPN